MSRSFCYCSLSLYHIMQTFVQRWWCTRHCYYRFIFTVLW